jgi:D-alanyl-D-alanine endopeptidase (penicillin-binding protein 7)
MTARAKELGLKHTNFVEPTGLSPNNVSTAREMMHILREALKVPALTESLQTERYVMTGIRGKLKRRVEFRNTDRLLWRRDLDVIGGKTGYTDLARYCFAVGLKLQNNHDIGMVLMGAEGKNTRFADVARLVQWIRKEWKAEAYATNASAKPWEWHPPLNISRGMLTTKVSSNLSASEDSSSSEEAINH